MPPRPGPSVIHDGTYPTTPPPAENQDPFNQNGQRYYDNESEHNVEVYRRDTHTSDSSNPGEQGYYDQNGGNYDSYRKWDAQNLQVFFLILLPQLTKIPTRTMLMVNDMLLPLNL